VSTNTVWRQPQGNHLHNLRLIGRYDSALQRGAILQSNGLPGGRPSNLTNSDRIRVGSQAQQLPCGPRPQNNRRSNRAQPPEAGRSLLRIQSQSVEHASELARFLLVWAIRGRKANLIKIVFWDGTGHYSS